MNVAEVQLRTNVRQRFGVEAYTQTPPTNASWIFQKPSDKVAPAPWIGFDHMIELVNDAIAAIMYLDTESREAPSEEKAASRAYRTAQKYRVEEVALFAILLVEYIIDFHSGGLLAPTGNWYRGRGAGVTRTDENMDMLSRFRTVFEALREVKVAAVEVVENDEKTRKLVCRPLGALKEKERSLGSVARVRNQHAGIIPPRARRRSRSPSASATPRPTSAAHPSAASSAAPSLPGAIEAGLSSVPSASPESPLTPRSASGDYASFPGLGIPGPTSPHAASFPPWAGISPVPPFAPRPALTQPDLSAPGPPAPTTSLWEDGSNSANATAASQPLSPAERRRDCESFWRTVM